MLEQIAGEVGVGECQPAYASESHVFRRNGACGDMGEKLSQPTVASSNHRQRFDTML
jgi:hypothetical protein